MPKPHSMPAPLILGTGQGTSDRTCLRLVRQEALYHTAAVTRLPVRMFPQTKKPRSMCLVSTPLMLTRHLLKSVRCSRLLEAIERVMAALHREQGVWLVRTMEVWRGLSRELCSLGADLCEVQYSPWGKRVVPCLSWVPVVSEVDSRLAAGTRLVEDL